MGSCQLLRPSLSLSFAQCPPSLFRTLCIASQFHLVLCVWFLCFSAIALSFGHLLLAA